jgi:hypothetical protein
MRRTRLPTPPVTGWAGYPIGFVAATAVTIVTVATHATENPLWSVAALAATAAAVAAVTTMPAAVAVTAVCWAMHAGFVLGRHGDLALTAQSVDAATVLAALAMAANLTAAAARTGARYLRTAAIPAATTPRLIGS